MPVFTIETPSGRKLDIEAGDEAAAIAGAQEWESQNPVSQDRSLKAQFGRAFDYPGMQKEIASEGLSQMGRGASQLLEPTGGDLLKSAGATLSGLANLAGGAVQYAGSPIWAGTRMAVGRPGEALGIPKELSEFATNLALPIPKMSLPTRRAKAVPTTEELMQSGAKGYETGRNAEFAVAPDLTEMLKGKIADDLHRAGYRASNPAHKPVFEAIDELPVGRYGDVSDIVSARQALQTAGADPRARDAVRRAVTHIDDFMENKVPELAPARSDFAAAYRTEDFTEAVDRASRAKTSFDLAMRDQARSLRNNEKMMRGWSEEEKAQLDKIAKGSTAAYLSSKTSSALGGKGGWWGIVTGVKTGGAAPAAGFGFQKLSEILTTSEVAKMEVMLRSRSSLAKQMASPMSDWGRAAQEAQASPNARNLSRLMIASRNLSNNLKDVDIAVGPNELLKSLFGQKPAGAEPNSNE